MEDYSMRPQRRPKASMAVTIVICILFGLLTFIFALSSTALLCLRNTLSESALSSAVGSINPSELELGMFMDEDAIAKMAEDWYLPASRINEDSTIADTVCETAAQYGLSISPITIDELLEESGIMPAIGELVGTYELYIMTGEDEKVFSRRNIMSKIKDQRSDIKEYTGIDISIFYDEIEKTLRENARDLDKLNPSELTEGAGKYTSVFLSLPVIITAFAAGVVMMIIALIITKRPVACTRTFGIVITAVGAVPITAAVLLPTILKTALGPLRPNAVRYISDQLGGAITPIFTKIGFVLIGAGSLLIAVSIVCGIILRKLAAKKTETPAAV